ncbi:MAG: Fic family protein [Candidatus Micrarchaeota archaeon]|nr:Fic family protein [Candidatus Micrarchaeota archaeon]
MARIVKRKVKGKLYYYLEESIKQGLAWKKESLYLGDSVPGADELRRIYTEFAKKLKMRGVEGITPPYTEFLTRNMALKLELSTKNKEKYLKSLTPAQRAEFVKRERITFISDSNAIEGSTLDYKQTEDILAGEERVRRLEKKGVVITGTGREAQEAVNLNACLGMYEKFLVGRREINEEMVLRLHFVLLSKIEGYEQYRGIWRPVNVMIRGSPHVFPHHSEVFGLMRELFGWYSINKGLIHPVELAAKFHTKFTGVHPFADGNGRMARLLMNYILQSNGFPFTNIPLRRRSAYMKTQAAGNKNDHKPFTLFLVEEAVKQCNKLGK